MADSKPVASDGVRNLVVCCDGTNNTLTGGVEDTNVLLLYAYLRKHTAGTDTTLFYDPGVGSPDAAPPTDPTDLIKRRLQRIAGLASGRGVYDNIADGYRFLMQNSRREDDRIFCFGFSRGAFTARCIVGMVNLFGMLRPEHEALLPTLIRIYFSQPPLKDQVCGRNEWKRALARGLHVGLARPDTAASEAGYISEEAAERVTRGDLAEQVKRNFARPAHVHWVGVWDTVESVGLPLISSRDNPSTATFHDKPGIRNVRHALALDEHRMTFLPRLYDAPSEITTPDGRTLKQLWFPGVHCDVGGSYQMSEAGLADAALVWMLEEVAPELGLALPIDLPGMGPVPYDDLGMPRRAQFPSAVRKRHDALWDTPWWALGGMTLRSMQTHRVRTYGDEARAEAEKKRGGSRPAVGVAVDVKAAGPLDAGGRSVWDARRKLWPLLAAMAVCVLALFAGGLNLPRGVPADVQPARWVDTPGATCTFALQQLATISPWRIAAPEFIPGCRGAPAGGLRDPLVWAGVMQHAPAWALVWDFVFIGGIGYLIARLSSRGFTYMAGFSRPGQRTRRWRWIGVLPLAAIGADAAENAATLAAIAASVAGVGWLTTLLLCMVGVLSLAKLLGYAACALVFVPTRVLLALRPSRRVGQVGRKPGVAGGEDVKGAQREK